MSKLLRSVTLCITFMYTSCVSEIHDRAEKDGADTMPIDKVRLSYQNGTHKTVINWGSQRVVQTTASQSDFRKRIKVL